MPHRKNLLDTLTCYSQTWADLNQPGLKWSHSREWTLVEQFKLFVSKSPECFHRTNHPGHMTGSAMVVNTELTQVLLTHHRKLGFWLQLGGHADGNPVMHKVAMDEALEESGLKEISFLPYEHQIFNQNRRQAIPFDLDCHQIPKSTKDPEHQHFDIRYVMIADSNCKPVISDESHDVRWFTLDEARNITQEESMHRQFAKIDWLREKLLLT